ncbi:MAG TPA: ABC transporter substrate-binding protein [Methylomirabilota bacterium]|jgi:putative tryptophan/tyrosine transport system substrate-binding protein|nr:ABC transporter substrate-binding protein [Methylomirabilota bacterium]
MSRRRLIVALVLLGLLAPWLTPSPRAAAPLPRLGIVTPGERGPGPLAFEKALPGLGWIPGQNVLLEYRHARGDLAAIPRLVAELIALDVRIIVSSSQAIPAAVAATRSIPIVMAFAVDDPVEQGWAASLARPGGNVTGVTLYVPELTAKRLEILKHIVPGLGRVGILAPRGAGGPGQAAVAEQAARALGLSAHVERIGGVGDYAPAFDAMKRAGVQGVLVLSSSAFFAERQRISELAVRHRLPLASPFREISDAGGLLAYGPSITGLWSERVPFYVDRLLKGSRPGDLPIEQPTTFEMVLNLKTARALGLSIPRSLILRADRVIE